MMATPSILLSAAACLVIALLGTSALRHLALRWGTLDVPNARSSHTVPTPRSGGAAIYAALMVGLLILFLTEQMRDGLFAALVGGGSAVALVGYLDDRRQLSALVRLVVHFAAAIWALVAMGGLPAVSFGGPPVEFGWPGYVLGTLTIVWAINLFNFMDGIDGLAGSESVFISTAASLLGLAAGIAPAATAPALLLAASSLGFLFWNWPPARIFMGDVGSGFIGYSLAVLALASGNDQPVAPLLWWILGGYFFMDATITLALRLVRGERVSQAHRSHGYQSLALRWRSHCKATLSILLVNVLWLLPMAALVVVYPAHALILTLSALLPIGAWILVLDVKRRRAFR